MMAARRLRLFPALFFLFACALRAEEPQTAPISSEFRMQSGSRVWVYLPPDTLPDAKLPCVIVPPAGSRLFHGMRMVEGDREEHLPYAAGGFAVISFDISGDWPDEESAAAQRKALVAFMKARCGVKDALDALQATLGKYPQIDPKRIYVAGHSSAGTLALQIASASDQIKACVAYAPVTDVEKHLIPGTLKELDKLAPGMAAMLHEYSPVNRVKNLKCPVFLFHARDDSAVPPGPIIAFKNTLVADKKAPEYVLVDSGDHYDSMIREGIPKGLAWLKSIDQKRSKP